MKEIKKLIPEDIALELCQEIRKRNRERKLSFAKVQCWGCMKYSTKKNNIKHRCIFSNEDNRGCQLVNKLYDERNLK